MIGSNHGVNCAYPSEWRQTRWNKDVTESPSRRQNRYVFERRVDVWRPVFVDGVVEIHHVRVDAADGCPVRRCLGDDRRHCVCVKLG